MTDFYSAEWTKAHVNVPSEKINRGKLGADINVAYAEFSLSAALTTSDELFLFKLPKGAILHEVILYSTDMGTTGDFNMGWSGGTNSLETADADGILAAVDVNAAAAVHRMSDVAATAATGMGREFIDEVDISIVPSENGTATSGTIKVVAFYSIA